MKKLRVLLMLLLGILFLSCEKEDNEKDLNLNSNFLKQTNWRGTLTLSDGSTSKVGIFFKTDTLGQHEYITNEGKQILNKISYIADNKLISLHFFDRFDDVVRVEDWLLVRNDKNNNKLIFKRGLYTEKMTSTLELTRIN